MEQADDARREAEAKKVIEGHHRIKRRGNDFLSDEEDDEEGRPRLTKRQRKERRLAQAKAVLELGDEANVFVDTYDEDLDTDNEIEEDDAAPAGFMSPDKQVWSAQERQDMLRARARMNESVSFNIDEQVRESDPRRNRSKAASLRTTRKSPSTLFQTRRALPRLRHKTTTRMRYVYRLRDLLTCSNRGTAVHV